MTLRDLLVALLTTIVVSTGFLVLKEDGQKPQAVKPFVKAAINKRAPKKKPVTTKLYNPKTGVELVDLKPTLKAAQDALASDDGCALRVEEVERVQIALNECDERFNQTQDELEFLRDDYQTLVGIEQMKPATYPEEFEEDRLKSRFEEAINGTGIKLKEMECSEFPCILVGTFPKELRDELGTDFFKENFPDSGSNSTSMFGAGEKDTYGFAISMYPPDLEDVDTYELGKRIQMRQMKIQNVFAEKAKAAAQKKE